MSGIIYQMSKHSERIEIVSIRRVDVHFRFESTSNSVFQTTFTVFFFAGSSGHVHMNAFITRSVRLLMNVQIVKCTKLTFPKTQLSSILFILFSLYYIYIYKFKLHFFVPFVESCMSSKV